MKLKVSDNIESLIPYPPGKPIEELEREYGISGSIKLASNENALGPSPKAAAAIAGALTKLHIYPDGSCYYLANRLAAKLGVKPEEIVFGNGSNEIIELLTTTFVSPGEEVISSLPTFLVYQKVVQSRGGVNRVVPLKEMHHDLDAIADNVTEKTRLIFLDNPNNPTGTVFQKNEFQLFLEKIPENVIVVLDEAYVDFVDPDMRLDVRNFFYEKTPVVALRTFSKAYGLAALRIGYGLMRPEIADYLHRVRQPFNVNYPAQVGGMAALDDEEHYQNTLKMTRDSIDWLSSKVRELGCIPFPSHTNYVLVDVKTDADSLYKKLLSRGVIIRGMKAYGYPNYIRITAGLPDQNRRFISALTESLKDR